jgi:integrase
MACRGHGLSLLGRGEAVGLVVFRFMRRCYCVLSQRPSRYPLYHRVLRKRAKAVGIDGKSFGPHALRATAATNALDRGADLGKVQEWLSARQRLDHPALRPAPLPARRQSHL